MRRKRVWSDQERSELERLWRTSPLPHVRARALAVLHVAKGKSIFEASEAVLSSRASVGTWVERYKQRGCAGLGILPGRGRPSSVDAVLVESHLRQSPRQFGISRTRWSLAALCQVVPGLKGLTPSGAYRALARLGFGFKRGQPFLHSPDPAYEEKKGSWQRL